MSQDAWSTQPVPPVQQQAEPPREILASFGQRVGAFVIDTLVLLPGYIASFIGGAMLESSDSVLGYVLLYGGFLGHLALFIWNSIIRQGRTGWSLGKQALGIRLVSIKDGRPIGAGASFLRQIVHILDALPCYLGYLWPIGDRKRQTFADKIMSTVVARQKKDA